MTDPIQVFIPKFRVDECLNEIRECLERGWTGLGFKTATIEQAWQDYTGLRHAHFVNSATAALHIALTLLKEERGWASDDEVVTTPLTFVSTNHAILYAGLRPVFADVDHYLCLDPDSLLDRITPKTRAVVFVGMGGNPGQYASVVEICRQHDLALILDAAHMAGTKLEGSEPGALADVTCYSFQAVKNMPTADSGMVCFQDGDLDRRARQFSWLGINKDTYSRWHAGTYAWRYDVDTVGYKYHGNSIMASLALVALKYLEEDNEYRRCLADRYQSGIGNIASLTSVPMAPRSLPSRHLYQVMTPARDELMAHLHKDKIFPGVHYRSNTDYPMYSYARGSCPKADEAASQLMSLPLHVNLSGEDVDRVCASVNAFFESTEFGSAPESGSPEAE